MSDTHPADSRVLDAESAVDYARSLGLNVVAGSARVLSGGVSSSVVELDGDPPIVLKQALPRLRVAAAWEADPRRSSTEAAALQLLHDITPDHVPEVLAAEADTHVLAVRRAPVDWRDWRAVLLEGARELDIERGRTAGEVLGRWHAATWEAPAVLASFEHSDAFEQLRLDPFHRELIRRRAVPAASLVPLIDELAGARQCLVHGDYSPKNLLVGDEGLWAIDAEVAHVGAAVFDLAFLVAHLALKAVYQPEDALVLRRTGAAFVSGYEMTNPGRVDPDGVARHAAAVMLARVAGKSPAPYLDVDHARRVTALAHPLLDGTRGGLESLWERTGVPA